MDNTAAGTTSTPDAFTSLGHQLEELQLIKFSLLPGELFTFVLPDEDAAAWTSAVDAYSTDPEGEAVQALKQRLSDHVQPDRSRDVYFELELPDAYPGAAGGPGVHVKGDALHHAEEIRWNEIVNAKLEDIPDCGFPTYQLLSEHLLPLLHAKLDAQSPRVRQAAAPRAMEPAPAPSQLHHALLTSHHLVSPQKRRSMQHWSAALSVSGFAKVGHPGVIYCAGAREAVEEFVRNVKAMQWLALRVRFVEPLANPGSASENERKANRRWVEYEKVGDVVEEMRRLGRVSYIVEMGIGSSAATMSK
ncbi:hypothetical protein HETIRDRAFT_468297 [Heterobasidion irregulare TC 32-1]|uniref:Small nuclear ribonucleoprotein Prp3 C-terminal domain-containing protein n=1 Tax=Heterobasidion irregulare (strain TC 32-1) TaxID=747525 RepID=W4KLS5_HETIT|nr:uncharacterized protein HETIRDRAFT_468297 [Heterobasidion irregulare TC 32-1]ETW86669.1 hypothetical protein HETIRDRAFT_468297 [Heterobasidion irregulare TC 32-1]